MKHYPYYIVPEVELYRGLPPESEEALRLSRLISANVGDLASRRLILGIDPPEFAKFYPDMDTITPGTFDTIDSFLDKFGGRKEVATGYAPVYSIEEETRPESLRDLIKDGRFDEAMQLIEAQNLNNPKKSIYFAHQMRFLRKLKAIHTQRNKPEADK